GVLLFALIPMLTARLIILSVRASRPLFFPLSLHDALPISVQVEIHYEAGDRLVVEVGYRALNTSTTDYTGRMYFGGTDSPDMAQDRKSTRLNSSHVKISYAAFCLKKKSQSTMLGFHTQTQT